MFYTNTNFLFQTRFLNLLVYNNTVPGENDENGRKVTFDLKISGILKNVKRYKLFQFKTT